MATNHNLFEEKGEPKWKSKQGPSAYQPNAIPLGQTLTLIKYSHPAVESILRARAVPDNFLKKVSMCI